MFPPVLSSPVTAPLRIHPPLFVLISGIGSSGDDDNDEHRGECVRIKSICELPIKRKFVFSIHRPPTPSRTRNDVYLASSVLGNKTFPFHTTKRPKLFPWLFLLQNVHFSMEEIQFGQPTTPTTTSSPFPGI